MWLSSTVLLWGTFYSFLPLWTQFLCSVLHRSKGCGGVQQLMQQSAERGQMYLLARFWISFLVNSALSTEDKCSKSWVMWRCSSFSSSISTTCGEKNKSAYHQNAFLNTKFLVPEWLTGPNTSLRPSGKQINKKLCTPTQYRPKMLEIIAAWFSLWVIKLKKWLVSGNI